MYKVALVLLSIIKFVCGAEKVDHFNATLSSVAHGRSQNVFLKELSDQLNTLNPFQYVGTLTCGLTIAGKLYITCSNSIDLNSLYLKGYTLNSIPSSISFVSRSLNSISLINTKLNSLGDEFGLLTNLVYIELGNNQLSSLPNSFASLSQLSSLALHSNSFASLPSLFTTFSSLVHLNLAGNQLNAFPESLSSLPQLTGLILSMNNLLTTPNWFSALTNIEELHLDQNKLSSIPTFISKLPKISRLLLNNNLLSTLPNEFSSLALLERLYLNDNPSLQTSTELFNKMKSLRHIDVTNTLVYGLSLNDSVSLACSSSCISFSDCTPKNPSCPCSSFFADSCPDSCGLSAQQLCVECSKVVSKQQCSGDCSWCSGKKDGLNCYWCDFAKNGCTDLERCSVCSGYLTFSECDSSGCHWCDYDYCVENVDSCVKVCSNLEKENCSSDLGCSWCSSYQACIDSTSQCLSCNRFTSSFCPPGCDCSSSSDSNSTVLIVVCAVCGVFFVICVCLFVLFVLKKKTVSASNEMNTFSNSNTSLRFENDFGMNEASENFIVSRYSECVVDSFFRVSSSILSFSSSGSPLKLCSPVTVSFEITNVCGMELVVDGLFVRGFKEKHEFFFSPSSFSIGVNEKRKISVELMIKCSATLSPSKSFICCGVSTKQQWCSLCGIQAQSELSPLLSCDDIKLKRELGRGAFGKVFLGSFKGTEVAVKTYPSLTQEDNEKEANMFCKLHSPHIVTFFGISQTLNAMIIEYCKFGSVESLYDRKEMTVLMRLLICSDCSLGMKYLHSNGIIHRDLKPDNLLIVSFSKDVNTVRAKISDFGTSRFVNQTMKMTESIGTPSYMAPEVFNNESYGKKSDVYSFGLTVWSIFSKQIPYSELSNVQMILLKVNEGYRPQLCKDCPLNDLIERCWQTNSSDRPSFEEIVELLKQRIEA